MGVKNRIKKYCKSKKINVTDFEDSIGASNGYVNSISKSVGLEKLKLMIENYPNMNLKWLFTGAGDMEISTETKVHDPYVLEIQKKLIEKLEEEIKQLKKEKEPRSRSFGLYAAEPEPELKK